MAQNAQNALSVHKSAPKFSFTHSGIGTEKPKHGPSPGSYNRVKVDADKFARSASYTMVGASKMGGVADVGFAAKVPGPGAYSSTDVHSMSPPKWAFGSEARMVDKKRMKSAGPGQYDTCTQNDAVRLTMSSKLGLGYKKTITPAPGAYQPKFDNVSTIRAPEKMSFGSSSRGPIPDNKVPGPGRYSSSQRSLNAGYKTMPAFSMTGRWKDPPQKHPGPDFMSSTTSFK